MAPIREGAVGKVSFLPINQAPKTLGGFLHRYDKTLAKRAQHLSLTLAKIERTHR